MWIQCWPKLLWLLNHDFFNSEFISRGVKGWGVPGGCDQCSSLSSTDHGYQKHPSGQNHIHHFYALVEHHFKLYPVFVCNTVCFMCCILQCMTPHQLMSFCEVATSCELVSVRVNALAILGITGSSLAKEKNTEDTLQVILIVVELLESH